MDRMGNGSAPADEEDEPLAGRPDIGTNAEWFASGSAAVDIHDLSQRVISAEDRLLAYVDELENEVRRLRRELSGDASGYERTTPGDSGSTRQVS